MIFGFNSFDEKKYGSILDNDYFKIEAFPWTTNKLDTSKPIELKKCEQKDVKWIKVPLSSYYNNAICLKDKTKIDV